LFLDSNEKKNWKSIWQVDAIASPESADYDKIRQIPNEIVDKILF